MMRRTPRVGSTTTFGQRGGEGPNTGRKAVSYTCEAPDGTKLRRRFFGTRKQVIPAGQVVVAVLLPPHNGYGWMFWTVADTVETLPEYVLHAMRKHEAGQGTGPALVTVQAQRV